MTNVVEKLLKGVVLVKEVAAPASRRAWIEVALHDEDMPAYPLRTPPYAMTSISPFQLHASPESRFKVRTSSFDAEEIRQGLDPSYDDVGVYVVVDSLQALNAYLAERGVALNDFVESSQTDYPL
jgi:hypothetical protein